VLALFAVVAPLMVAAVLDLRQTGKMAPSEAMSASVLFAAVLAISTTIIVVRLYRVTLPRCRRLKALADQYREGPQ
jgi:energy-converting hydrogenase Eha subunit A